MLSFCVCVWLCDEYDWCVCVCFLYVPVLEFVCVERERFLGAIRTKVKLPGFKPAAAGPPATCPLPLPLYRPASRFPLFYFPSLLLHSHLPSLSFSLVPSSILPSFPFPSSSIFFSSSFPSTPSTHAQLFFPFLSFPTPSSHFHLILLPSKVPLLDLFFSKARNDLYTAVQIA